MTTSLNLARRKQARPARRGPGLGRLLRLRAPLRSVGFREQLTFLLALSLAPYLLLSLYNANQAYVTYRNQLEHTVLLASEVISAREKLLLEETRFLLQGIGGNVGLRLDSDTNTTQCRPGNSDDIRMLPHLIGFQAIDALGQTICRYGNDLSVEISSERFAFRQSSSLVSLVPDRTPQQRAIGLVSVPWKTGENGETSGQLIAALDTLAFTEATQDLALPGDTSIALIDTDGNYLTLAGDDPANVQWLPRQEVLPLADKSGASSLVARDGKERLYIVRKLGESQMLLVAAAPIASVRDMALFVLLSGIAGSLLMLLLMLGAVWWLFHHFVTRPVASLEKTFLAYANGNLSVRARPQAHAAREIRSLAVSFNRMAGSFSEINQNLVHAAVRERALRRELHHRVNNNMQIILGLLNLEARAANRAEEISQLNNLIQRVLAISIVHRRFYEGLRTDMIDFTSSLSDLLDRLRNQDNASPLVRSLKLDAASCELPIDQAVPLALLVCEWVRALNHIGIDEPLTPTLRLTTERANGLVSMKLTGIETISPQEFDDIEDVSRKLINVLRKQLDHQGREQGDTLWEIRFRARGSSGI